MPTRPLPENAHFVAIDFTQLKAFNTFTLRLRRFNILVGPNNAGKSTILAAFRILAAAMRRATKRAPVILKGPGGPSLGYPVDLTTIPVAEENIFFNYDNSQPAPVRFKLSNKNQLVLCFPEQRVCYLFADAQGTLINTPSLFRSHFNCPIGFVPILGPVEHDEHLFEKEVARLALFNYRAARNFRNIWYHYPEKFDEFRNALVQTWPGMDIQRPTVDITSGKPLLHMFCPEDKSSVNCLGRIWLSGVVPDVNAHNTIERIVAISNRRTRHLLALRSSKAIAWHSSKYGAGHLDRDPFHGDYH